MKFKQYREARDASGAPDYFNRPAQPAATGSQYRPNNSPPLTDTVQRLERMSNELGMLMSAVESYPEIAGELGKIYHELLNLVGSVNRRLRQSGL